MTGNKRVISQLKAWMKSWSSINDFENYMDLYGDDMEDEDFSGNQLKNTVLLSGKSGVGKTQVVYECAEELQYEVIEINCSEERTGKRVLSLFGEAAQSHRLQKDTNKRTRGGIQQFCSTKKRKASQNTQSSSKNSLILLDEVDVVFKDDAGFYRGVKSLMETAKRPIVLICNERIGELRDLDLIELRFQKKWIRGCTNELFDRLSSQGYIIHYQELLQTIALFKNDMRKASLNIQFWSKDDGTEKSYLMERIMGLPSHSLWSCSSSHDDSRSSRSLILSSLQSYTSLQHLFTNYISPMKQISSRLEKVSEVDKLSSKWKTSQKASCGCLERCTCRPKKFCAAIVSSLMSGMLDSVVPTATATELVTTPPAGATEINEVIEMKDGIEVIEIKDDIEVIEIKDDIEVIEIKDDIEMSSENPTSCGITEKSSSNSAMNDVSGLLDAISDADTFCHLLPASSVWRDADFSGEERCYTQTALNNLNHAAFCCSLALDSLKNGQNINEGEPLVHITNYTPTGKDFPSSSVATGGNRSLANVMGFQSQTFAPSLHLDYIDSVKQICKYERSRKLATREMVHPRTRRTRRSSRNLFTHYFDGMIADDVIATLDAGNMTSS